MKPNSAALNDIDLVVAEASKIVQRETGVQLGEKQSAMVHSRLTKRMLELGIASPTSYLDYLSSNLASETKALISLLTTHHTFFFREFSHFEYLEKKGLAQIIAGARQRKERTLKIWCAACSRGQEAYSLAMFLKFHLSKMAPDLGFELICNDVDPESVGIAKNGVYRWEELKQAPSLYVADHWVKGTGEISDFVKAKKSIKDHCNFSVLNLLDIGSIGSQKFDLIFCRNVFIYFTQQQIASIAGNMVKHLHDSGLFFIALSESFNGLSLPMVAVGPSIYGHKASVEKAPAKVVSITEAKASKPAAKAQKVRVLCVDDSPVVLTLLKKILGEGDGFEVVATAKDGLEASEILKKQPVDVMTLDIHMPNQDGISYLEKNYNSKHPAVVMVSSVSREESALGLRALQLGATDYVEKPVMATLAERADEIRMKLRCAVKSKLDEATPKVGIAGSFEKKLAIQSPENKLRVIVGSLGDRKKIRYILEQCKGVQPGTVVLLYGSESLTSVIGQELHSSNFTVDSIESAATAVKNGMVYFGDFRKAEFVMSKLMREKKHVQLMLLGGLPDNIASKIATWSTKHIIAEENAELASPSLKQKVAETIPYTSFAYHSDKQFCEES